MVFLVRPFGRCLGDAPRADTPLKRMEADTKWLPFYRRHFQIEKYEKIMYFVANFNEIPLTISHTIGSGNDFHGVVGQQGITWTNGDRLFWHYMASLGHNELRHTSESWWRLNIRRKFPNVTFYEVTLIWRYFDFDLEYHWKFHAKFSSWLGAETITLLQWS